MLSYLRRLVSYYQIKAYKPDNTSVTYDVPNMSYSNKIYTLNIDYEGLLSLLNLTEIKAVDIWVSIGDQPPFYKSNPLRFIFSRQTLPNDDIFLFENALGSMESIVFEGEKEEIQNHKSTAYKIDDATHEFRNDYGRTFKKSTGYFKNEELRLWASEFFSSKKRYHLVNGVVKEIYVNSMDAKSVKYDLNDYSFEFVYSEDSRYRSVERASSLPAL